MLLSLVQYRPNGNTYVLGEAFFLVYEWYSKLLCQCPAPDDAVKCSLDRYLGMLLFRDELLYICNCPHDYLGILIASCIAVKRQCAVVPWPPVLVLAIGTWLPVACYHAQPSATLRVR
mmetsp:Transcript_81405/g.161591  ORF Transcript_81405/g.161591 Transcript_81405/m.161591 type:complete len:118 (+) Transcript_81405:318-671(+)